MMEKPTIDYTRIVVTEDIHGVDGRLRVEKGSVGTIRSYNQGFVGVIFDDGPTYGSFRAASAASRTFLFFLRSRWGSDGRDH